MQSNIISATHFLPRHDKNKQVLEKVIVVCDKLNISWSYVPIVLFPFNVCFGSYVLKKGKSNFRVELAKYIFKSNIPILKLKLAIYLSFVYYDLV